MSEKAGGVPPGNEPPPSYSPPAYNPQQQYGAPQAYYNPQQYGGQPQQYGGPPQQYGGQFGMQQSNNTVVVNQPMSTNVAVPGYVPDNMGLAIFVTICCFWPLGIMAIMRASEARSALNRGDMQSASLLSGQAKRYSMWALLCGILTIIFAVVVVVAIVVTNINNQCYYC